MRNGHHIVFDLGIPYNRQVVRRLFEGYFLTEDRPKETSLILKECDCQHTTNDGVSSIWTFVRWGSSQARDHVGISFGQNGNLMLQVGWDYKNSRYTAKALFAICKKIILIILALQKYGVILGDAYDHI